MSELDLERAMVERKGNCNVAECRIGPSVSSCLGQICDGVDGMVKNLVHNICVEQKRFLAQKRDRPSLDSLVCLQNVQPGKPVAVVVLHLDISSPRLLFNSEGP